MTLVLFDRALKFSRTAIHEDEKSAVEPTRSENQQTLSFYDDTETENTEWDIARDSLLKDPFLDVDIHEVLVRPFLIKQISIDSSSSMTVEEIRPSFELLSKPYFQRALSNYHYFRAGIKIRATVNGSPFVYGRAYLSFMPVGRLPVVERIAPVTLQMRPEPLDYTDSHTVELSWPWLSPYDWADLNVPAPAHFGSLYFTPVVPLRNSADVVNKVTISIYANFEDPAVAGHRAEGHVTAHSGNAKNAVSLNGRPIKRIGQRQMQDAAAQEGVRKTEGSISGVVKAASTIAPLLAPVPLVGEVAMMAGPILSVLGPILEGLGLSKPRLTPGFELTMTTGTRLSHHVSGGSAALRTCLDPDQHLGEGVVPEREWDLRRIAQVPALIKRVSVSPATAASPGTSILSVVLEPKAWTTLGASPAVPARWVAQLYRYWRGSVKLKFEFLCSRFVTARFAIRFKPRFNSNAALDDNHVTNIVDVQGNTTINLVIPFLSDTRFVENYGAMLEVCLLNSIVGTDTTLANPVEILIWGALGEDIQFHVLLPRSEMPASDVVEAHGLWDDFKSDDFQPFGEAASGVVEAGFVADEQVYDVTTILKAASPLSYYVRLRDIFLFQRGSERKLYHPATPDPVNNLYHSSAPHLIVPSMMALNNERMWEVEEPFSQVVPYVTPDWVMEGVVKTTLYGALYPSNRTILYSTSEDTELGWFVRVPPSV